MNEKKPPLVVVFPRGQLNAKDKERFTKAGILAIEADDPKQVVQLQLAEPLHLQSTGITGDAIVSALLRVIANESPHTPGGSITSIGVAAHEFVKRLADAVEGNQAYEQQMRLERKERT